MRILLDQNAPRGLREHFPAHTVFTALQMGWDTLENGALIAAAETAGFHVLVTGDQNLRYQQNLSERRIALVVLNTNHWNVIKESVHRVIEAVGSAVEGGYIELEFERPPLVRRPYRGSGA